MAGTEERARIGEWMRYAACLARLTGREIAARMKLKTEVTVYRWWAGARIPRPANLSAYALIVGQPVAYFYQSSAPPGLSRARVRQVVVAADQILSGSDDEASLREIAAGLPALTEQQRQALSVSKEDFRALVAQLAGKALDQMTTAERRRILWELAEIVVAAHPEEEPAAAPPG